MFQIEFDGKVQVLTKNSYTIGRAPDCDIKIGTDGSMVSRQHARLVRTATGWDVIDLGSQNGTFVNGEQVDRRILAVGDELRFNGSEIARFGIAPEGHSEATLIQDQTNPGNGYGHLASRIDHIENRLEEISAQSSAFHESQSGRLDEAIAAMAASSELAPRIVALEEQAAHSAAIDRRILTRLNTLEVSARKVLGKGLVLVCGLAALGFGTLLLDESDRKEYQTALLDSVGGPAGVVSFVVTVLSGAGAYQLRAAKEEPDPGKDEKSNPD
jgi:hypothetical protein